MEEIREIVQKIVYDLYGVDFEVAVTESPAELRTDYSMNVALKLAKELHRAPMEIAEEIKNRIEEKVGSEGGADDGDDDSAAGELKGMEITVSRPGFLNFSLPGEYYAGKIEELVEDFAGGISLENYAGQTVICEFSDPNPFKVLHVGHLYTSIVGDSISRLFEYAGARVVRANFGGDVGLHVAKTMYALKRKKIDELKIETIAECYVEGTRAYEEDESAKAEITALNKEIYKINAEDLHDSEVAKLYWKGRELSYDYFKDFYASIGVKFDKFYPESTVAGLGMETVERELVNGVYEKSDGAVVFDGEKYGLHTRVFINQEGVPTYETKDVGLIFTKWEDYHFDKSVVITGSEQLEYMKVVLKSVEQYAPELVERTSHLTHGLVKLPGNQKMSSRKGNFLKAVDVLAMVREALKEEHGSEDEKVALAATKYAFLKHKMGANIIFDPKESVEMTGNSGPYLLYSSVRAKKILGKTREPLILETRPAGPSPWAAGANSRAAALRNLSNKDSRVSIHERLLAKKILEYKSVLKDAVTNMAPYKVANYLYEVSQEFSRFYENCPVAGSEREAERAKLVKVYLDIMTHGLDILGIKIPEEM